MLSRQSSHWCAAVGAFEGRLSLGYPCSDLTGCTGMLVSAGGVPDRITDETFCFEVTMFGILQWSVGVHNKAARARRRMVGYHREAWGMSAVLEFI